MEVCMGWLGWTEQQTQETSFAAIDQALKGRVAMLQKCFGGGEEAPVEPAPLPATAIFGAFRAAAKQ